MEILAPMLGMITLTGLMVVVLYATRAPLIIKFWGNAQGARHSEDLRPQLPYRLRYVTDNYNHLFEQPVLFYAVVVYIFLSNHSDSLHVQLAWGYVGLRVIHSIIHLTSNNVSWRATVFGLSSLCLVAMIIRELLAVF